MGGDRCYRRIHIPGRAAERLTSIGTTRQPGREARRAKVPGWEDVTLPKRQPRGGYQEPDLPLGYPGTVLNACGSKPTLFRQ